MASELQVLSPTKQEIIKLKQKQAKEQEKVNKYDWLSNITASGGVSKNDENQKTQDYSLSLSQDIFRFGGIRSQIEYAKELKAMKLLEIDENSKNDLSTLYTTLVDLKLTQISIEKNLLNVENAKIDVKHKKSEYEQGEVGISDLNDAIMKRNELQDANKELKLTKLTDINTIKQYTNRAYSKLLLPKPKLISQELFVQNVLAVKYAKSNAKVNNYLYEIKKSDYLPKVSLNGSVGHEKVRSVADDYYNYGIKVSLPLSYTASNAIEQTRLEYLISKEELNDKKRDATIVYNSAILRIKNYEERIILAKEDIKLYNELLKMNKQEYEAGFKTKDDVKSIENSMQIRALDIKSYELNIQKQILNLYFQM
jgi:outer membrane protein TolC